MQFNFLKFLLCQLIFKRSTTGTKLNVSSHIEQKMAKALEDEMALKWVATSEYKCKICQLESADTVFNELNRYQFEKHLWLKHKKSKTDYVGEFGSLESTPAQETECQLCGKTVKRDLVTFKNHLQDKRTCPGNMKKKINYISYYKEFIQSKEDFKNELGFKPLKLIDCLESEDIGQQDTRESSKSGKPELANLKEGEIRKDECTKMLSEQEEAREWVCSVKYRCKICNSQFGIKWNLKTHIQRIHGKFVEDYKKQYGEILIDPPKLAICQMCGKSVKRERRNFSNHLNSCKGNVESIKLKEYYSRYIRVKKEATEKDKAREWVCSVKYGCKICKNQKNYMYACELKRHFAQKHKLSEEEYVKQYGEIGSNPPKLTKCLMCGRTIKREMSLFKNHLTDCWKNVDKLRYCEYYSKYISQNLGLQANTIDESWMDRCQFSCKLCSITTSFKSVDEFELHLKETHNGKTYQEFKREFGDPCSLLKLAACAICEEPVVWEKTIFSDHLSTNHSIDPQAYYSNYL